MFKRRPASARALGVLATGVVLVAVFVESGFMAKGDEAEEEHDRFVACFPENVRHLLESGSGKELAEAMPDKVSLTVSVSRALGFSDYWWSSAGPNEQLSLEAAATIGGKDFYLGLEKLRDDRMGLVGAARLFFNEGFDQKAPGTKARTEWIVRLATAVFTDGLDEDKTYCLSFLKNERQPAVKSLLVDVFHGKVGKEINLEESYGDEPGLRVGAALALVMMGDKALKPEIERLLPATKEKENVAALEVCLALLGDPSYIKAEHFSLESGSIGIAGLNAIERFKGAHGMEALVKGGLAHSWAHVNDEAIKTFARITGHDWTEGEIEDWWEVEHEGHRRPQPIHKLVSNDRALFCVAYSGDGALVATGSNDDTARVWNSSSGKLVATLRGHEFTVFDVAFHPSGDRLATASGDETIKIWDVATGKLIRTLRGHSEFVENLAYSPTGDRLISAGADGVRVWNPDAGKQIATWAGGENAIANMAVRPDAARVALTFRPTLTFAMKNPQIWDVSAGKLERTLEEGADTNWSLAYSPRGDRLAIVDHYSRNVNVVDAVTGKAICKLAGKSQDPSDIAGHFSDVAFSADGAIIGTTHWDNSVILWDASTGKEITSFKAHTDNVDAIAFSPDGKHFVTASSDNSARIWDLQTVLSFAKQRPEDAN